ncbi:hypothetical protein ScPMuIL_003437, partial [Solemya velum]
LKFVIILDNASFLKMAGSFFAGLGQTIAGGIAVAATLGQVDGVIEWTKDGADKVDKNAKETWGADGDITKFVEGMPVLGYVASAGHGIAAAITKDEEDLQRARRACGSSTKSTLVTAGAIGGTLIGGAAGAVAGATLGSIGGQCSEKGINHANDKEFQTSAGTYHDFNVGSFVAEAAFDGVLGGVSSGTTAVIGKTASRQVVGESLKQAGGGGVKRALVKRTVESAISKPVTKCVDVGLKQAYDPRK